jgi:putative PIN family toxin of toxin-antitoxin system
MRRPWVAGCFTKAPCRSGMAWLRAWSMVSAEASAESGMAGAFREIDRRIFILSLKGRQSCKSSMRKQFFAGRQWAVDFALTIVSATEWDFTQSPMMSYTTSVSCFPRVIECDTFMLRIVLDTDVMFAAFDSPQGASRALLLEALDGKVQLLLSTTLMVEYEAVLSRSANLMKFGVGIADVLGVLDEMAAICIPVAFDYRWRPGAADPDDDLVLETAINGAANVIATFNLTDIKAGAVPFGISVERPKDVLRRVRA